VSCWFAVTGGETMGLAGSGQPFSLIWRCYLATTVIPFTFATSSGFFISANFPFFPLHFYSKFAMMSPIFKGFFPFTRVRERLWGAICA
jgi:hypothetical protein